MKRRAPDKLAPPPALPFFPSTTSNKGPSLPSSSSSPPSEFLLAKALFEFSRSGTITRNHMNNNSNSSNKRATTATKCVQASLPYPRVSSPEAPSLSGSKSGSQPIRPPGTPPPPSLHQSPPASPYMTRQIHKLAMDQLVSHLSRDPALLNKLIATILTEVQKKKKKNSAAIEPNTTAPVVQPSGEQEIQEAMLCLTGNNNNNNSAAAPSQREKHNTLVNVTIAATATINQSKQQLLPGASEDMSEEAINRRLGALEKLEALKHKLEARLAVRRKYLSEQQKQVTNQPSSTVPSLSTQTLVPLSDSMESCYLWSHTSLPQQQQKHQEQQMVSSQTTDSGCDSLYPMFLSTNI